MSYALDIGLRYLRSKKRSTISVITFIAVTGVALGVAALVSVLSITSGFQDEFRNKVLGVNAHVLVLKYGLDFEEYRDVIARATDMPEVAGAGPFVINEMMLDPERMPDVLELPNQIVDGSLEGMRVPGAAPPIHPDQLTAAGGAEELDEYLQGLTADGGVAPDAGVASDGGEEEMTEEEMERLRDRIAETGGREPLFQDAGPGAAEWEPVWEREDREVIAGTGPGQAAGDGGEGDEGEEDLGYEPLPEVEVPTPEEMEEALVGLDTVEMPDEDEERRIFEEEAAESGEPVVPVEDLPGIVVGATLASNLGIRVGDRVRIISPLAGLDTSMWAPEARTPRSREFRVIGVFEAGFQEYDTRLVYVDLYEAQHFFDQGDTVTGVEIRLHDLEKAPEVARRLERELGGGPFHTMDWEELNRNLFTALEIQKIMLSLVIATIIVVAAFNVIATLIMIVLEKKREIAILKAMGATDSDVLKIFLVQGSIIGTVGTLIGLVLGGGVVAYLSAYEFPLDPKVYLIDHLPVRTSLWEFAITVLIALAICTTATLIPSWWAARLLPADGVRYE